MPAAIVIQFCCGSIYAWSVFNKPIDTLIYGEVVNMAPITFIIAIGFLGFSAAVMGPWLERRGPTAACLLGTILFFAGNLLTALALYVQQIWLVFVGYGVIAGYGVGLCYISPVSVLQKWFPDRRGLASGIAVCGFGAGSIAAAKIQIRLIDALGLPLTFVVLGSIYFALMTISSIVLRTPPPNFSIVLEPKGSNSVEGSDAVATVEAVKAISLIEALRSKDFRLMYLMFLANLIFGLVLISRLSNMVTDIFERSTEEAATVVSINGGFNLGGRLFFSIASDYVGRKTCYLVMLTTQLIILGVFTAITVTKTYWAFLLTMWVLTACYGAGFSVIPAFLSDTFGPGNIGPCHGVILTAWSIAGVVGGLTFTAVFNWIIGSGYSTKDAYPYNLNVWWILGFVFIGWVALLFVTPTLKDNIFNVGLKTLVSRMFCRSRENKQSYEMK